jgi:hypothetical protein
MNRTEFKKKVSAQWGPLSKEHSMVRELVKKSEKWDQHEYEKFGPPRFHESEREVPRKEKHAQLRAEKDSWLPNDREVFRITWSYLFARAGWIVMMYIIMFGFFGLMFLAMWMMTT